MEFHSKKCNKNDGIDKSKMLLLIETIVFVPFLLTYDGMTCVSCFKRTTRDRKIQSNTKLEEKDANDNEMIAIITNGLMSVCVFVCSCICLCLSLYL